MLDTYLWKILGIIAIVLLIIFWRKRNAVWGGLILGIFTGLILAIFFFVGGNGFDWSIIGKIAVFGTILGFATEILGFFSIS